MGNTEAMTSLHIRKLPTPVLEEYRWREPWSVFRLPVWNREKPKPIKQPFPVSRALAKVRAAHGQPT